jgi:carbonic anhydrase
MSDDRFADVMAANAEYAATADLDHVPGSAARGIAVLTCMDSRIDPLRMLGMRRGDAKILRNAGARVTDDILATLVVSRYLLGVERVMVVAHTRCRMASGTAADLHRAISEAGGPDTRDIDFVTTTDQEQTVRDDVERIRSSPYLPDLAVGGFRYDVDTGKLEQIC